MSYKRFCSSCFQTNLPEKLVCGCFKNGIYVDVYKNGTTKCKYKYSNNKRNGECIDYYDNGKMKRKYNTKNNCINGIMEKFSRNGVKREELHYSNDRIFGICKKYYLNKNIKYINNCDGKYKGIISNYYGNGYLVKLYLKKKIFVKNKLIIFY